MSVVADQHSDASNGSNKVRFWLLSAVAGGHFSTTIALYAMARSRVVTEYFGVPASMLVIFVCMALSLAATGTYVFLQRRG